MSCHASYYQFGAITFSIFLTIRRGLPVLHIANSDGGSMPTYRNRQLPIVEGRIANVLIPTASVIQIDVDCLNCGKPY